MSESHGNSVAAWTGVLIILVASALICLGIIVDSALMWIPGVIGVVVGAVAWIVLDKAGYGEKKNDGPTKGVTTNTVPQ